MLRLRRPKHVSSPKDRLAQEAVHLRDQAGGMPPGIRRDELLRKARQIEIATHIDGWLRSPGLQRPN